MVTPTFAEQLTSILGNVGSIVTAIISWAGSVVNFITSNPIILLFAVSGLAGYAFVTVKNFLHN
jgi:hypothetical protein